MSCNGCRILRRGCSENCILRPCLEWIETPQAQANATLFVSKFFGRSDLMSFISNVPESKRPALFHSLLFEACGRTVNPVNGAVGLLSSGNWHICQAAVETVLSGGVLRPMTVAGAGGGGGNHCMGIINNSYTRLNNNTTASFGQSRSEMTTTSEESMMSSGGGGKEPKLLNLFA